MSNLNEIYLGNSVNTNTNDDEDKNKRSILDTPLNALGIPTTDTRELGLANFNEGYAISEKESNKYAKYGITYNPNDDMNDRLANAQSNWEKAGNAFSQAVVDEILLGTIKGYSDIFDFMIANPINELITGEENDYTNPVSKWLGDLQEKFREDVAPIYVNSGVDIQHGGLENFGWYASNFPSVASTISLLIPGMGATRAMGFISKLTRLGKLATGTRRFLSGMNKYEKAIQAGKEAKLGTFARIMNSPKTIARGNQLVENLTQGTFMRIAENYQEASQTYNDMIGDIQGELNEQTDEEFEKWKQDHIEYFKDETDKDITNYSRNQVANLIANSAANRTFDIDMSNLVWDVIQLYGLKNVGKGLANIKSGTNKAIDKLQKQVLLKAKNILKPGSVSEAEIEAAGMSLKEMAKDKANYVLKYGLRDLGKAVVMEGNEGIEEFVNYVAQQEGLSYGKALLNNTESKDFYGDIYDYMADPQAQESAFWGVMGGLLFSPVGSAFNKGKLAYNRYEKQKVDAKSEQTTGESIKSSTSLKGFISLFETNEYRAAKEAMENRLRRFKTLKERIDEADKGRLIENEEEIELLKQQGIEVDENGRVTLSDEEAAIAKEKAYNEFLTNLVIDSHDSGTFDLLTDYLSDKDLQKHINDLGIFDDEINTNELTKRLNDINDKYQEECFWVYNRISELNGLSSNENSIPVDYVQILARENMMLNRRIEDNQNLIERTDKSIQRIEDKLINDSSEDEREGIRGQLAQQRDIFELQALLNSRQEALNEVNKLKEEFLEIRDNPSYTLKQQIDLAEKRFNLFDKKAKEKTANYLMSLGVAFDDNLIENDRAIKGFIDLTSEALDTALKTKKFAFVNKQLKEFTDLINSGDFVTRENLDKLLEAVDNYIATYNKTISSENKTNSDELANTYVKYYGAKMSDILFRDAKTITTKDIQERVDYLNNQFNEGRKKIIKLAVDKFTQFYNDNREYIYDHEDEVISILDAMVNSGEKKALAVTEKLIESLPEESSVTASELVDSIKILNTTKKTNASLYNELNRRIRNIYNLDLAQQLNEVLSNKTSNEIDYDDGLHVYDSKTGNIIRYNDQKDPYIQNAEQAVQEKVETVTKTAKPKKFIPLTDKDAFVNTYGEEFYNYNTNVHCTPVTTISLGNDNRFKKRTIKNPTFTYDNEKGKWLVTKGKYIYELAEPLSEKEEEILKYLRDTYKTGRHINNQNEEKVRIELADKFYKNVIGIERLMLNGSVDKVLTFFKIDATQQNILAKEEKRQALNATKREIKEKKKQEKEAKQKEKEAKSALETPLVSPTPTESKDNSNTTSPVEESANSTPVPTPASTSIDTEYTPTSTPTTDSSETSQSNQTPTPIDTTVNQAQEGQSNQGQEGSEEATNSSTGEEGSNSTPVAKLDTIDDLDDIPDDLDDLGNDLGDDSLSLDDAEFDMSNPNVVNLGILFANIGKTITTNAGIEFNSVYELAAYCMDKALRNPIFGFLFNEDGTLKDTTEKNAAVESIIDSLKEKNKLTNDDINHINEFLKNYKKDNANTGVFNSLFDDFRALGLTKEDTDSLTGDILQLIDKYREIGVVDKILIREGDNIVQKEVINGFVLAKIINDTICALDSVKAEQFLKNLQYTREMNKEFASKYMVANQIGGVSVVDLLIKRDIEKQLLGDEANTNVAVDVLQGMQANTFDDGKVSRTFYDTFTALKAGSRLILKSDKYGRFNLMAKDANGKEVIVGKLGVAKLDSDGSYRQNNLGWENRVWLQGNTVKSNLESLFKVLLNGAETKEQNVKYVALLNTLFEQANSLNVNDKNYQNKYNAIAKQFKSIAEAIHKGKFNNGKNKYDNVLLGEEDEDIIKQFTYLLRLKNYNDIAVANAIKNKSIDSDAKANIIANEINKLKNKTLKQWFEKIYNQYNLIANLQDKEVVVTSIDKGEAIQVRKKNDKPELMNSLPLAKQGLSKGADVAIAISEKADSLTMEGVPVTKATNMRPGSTIIALDAHSGTPKYVKAFGVEFSATTIPAYNHSSDTPLMRVLFDTAVNNIVNIITEATTNGDVSDCLNRLKTAFEDLMVFDNYNTKDNDKNAVYDVGAKHGVFRVGSNKVSLERKNRTVLNGYDGFTINRYTKITDKNGDTKTIPTHTFSITLGSPSDSKYFNVIYKKGRLHPGDLNGGSTNVKDVRTALFKFLQDAGFRYNIDKRLVRNQETSTAEATDNVEIKNNIITRNADGSITAKLLYGNEIKEYHYNSYTDFLVSNNLIRVNTQTNEYGSNYNLFGNDGKSKPKLSVSLQSTTTDRKQFTKIAERTSKDSNPEDFREALNILNDESPSHKGLELFQRINNLYGDSLVQVDDKLENLLREILPDKITYIDNLNYRDGDNGITGGAIAFYSNKKGTVVTTYTKNDKAKAKNVKTENPGIYVGDRYVNLVSSTDKFLRRQGITRLLHERVHEKFHSLSTEQRQAMIKELRGIFNTFKNTYTNDTNLSKEVKDYFDALFSVYTKNQSQRKLEEFLAESLTNSTLFNYLNSIQVKDVKHNITKSFFDKIVDFIRRLFGVKYNDNSLLAKELKAINDIINNNNGTTNIQEETKQIKEEQKEEIKEEQKEEQKEKESSDDNKLDDDKSDNNDEETKVVEPEDNESNETKNEESNELIDESSNTETVEDNEKTVDEEDDDFNFSMSMFEDLRPVKLFTNSFVSIGSKASFQEQLSLENQAKFDALFDSDLLNYFCR